MKRGDILRPFFLYMKLQSKNISKKFNDRHILRNLNISVEKGRNIAITGPNGSGKTTFIRILCGLIKPDVGTISYQLNGHALALENINEHIGLVGP